MFGLRRVHTNSLIRYREMPPEQRRNTVAAASHRILERNWVATPGFTMPNRRKYPWMWLWDSCFHAIAWSRLGDPRGVKELENVLSLQLPNGFVPHMGYLTKPDASLALWHSPGRSDITQPPMYGHALRVLAARGFAVEHLYGAATAGLDYVLEHRRDPGSGLIRVLHPWETGCDDSPRWDGWHVEPFDERRWNKQEARAGSIDSASGTVPHAPTRASTSARRGSAPSWRSTLGSWVKSPRTRTFCQRRLHWRRRSTAIGWTRDARGAMSASRVPAARLQSARLTRCSGCWSVRTTTISTPPWRRSSTGVPSGDPTGPQALRPMSPLMTQVPTGAAMHGPRSCIS